MGVFGLLYPFRLPLLSMNIYCRAFYLYRATERHRVSESSRPVVATVPSVLFPESRVAAEALMNDVRSVVSKLAARGAQRSRDRVNVAGNISENRPLVFSISPLPLPVCGRSTYPPVSCSWRAWDWRTGRLRRC